MQSKTLFRDLIPYRSGIVRVTPLDSNFKPIYDKAYTTARDFLTSTQRSTSYSYETFYTSNGDASDYITNRRENLSLTTQIYDPRFDALISGKESAKGDMLSLREVQFTIQAGSSGYIFNDTLCYPAISDDGKVHLEIRDSYGNRYNRVDSSPYEYQYNYDQSNYALKFSRESYPRTFSCVYYSKSTNYESYKTSSMLKNRVFMIEVFGEMQSASNGEKQVCYTCLKRATLSGELSGVTRQKSINNAITYNFSSAPTKNGETPCIESIERVNHNYIYVSSNVISLDDNGVLGFRGQNVIRLYSGGIAVSDSKSTLSDGGVLKLEID